MSNAQRKNDSLQKKKLLSNPIVSFAIYEDSKEITSEMFSKIDKINTNFGSLENELAYRLKVLDLVEKKGTESQIFSTKNHVLGLYASLNNDSGVIKTAKELLNYANIENEPSVVGVLYALKEVYRRNEQFEDLLKMLPRYHQFSKKYGYVYKGEDSMFKDIAYVHYSLKNYDKAIKAYKRVVKEMADADDNFHESSMINNIGLSFYGAKNNDSANYYFDKALKLIADKVISPEKKDRYAEHFINVIKSNKAEILLNEGELDGTLPFFKKELISGKNFNELSIVVGAYYNIARIAYLKNEPKRAIKYLDSTLFILNTYQDVKVKKKVLNLKARCYLHLDDYKSANLYFKVYENYVDSLNTVKARKNYMIDVVKHETFEKENALLISKEQLKSKEKESFYQQLGLGLFALIAIGLLFIYSRMKKGHAIIASQKMEVDRALEEKDVLLKEIHHRIKNNLQVVSSLLHVHSSKIQNKDFEELLDQSQRQIHSMSLVHEMLYQKENVSIVSMQDYLNELCAHLFSTFSRNDVSIKINANNISLSIDFANPIGLIVSELVVNSLKYAFNKNEGTITIELSKKEDVFTFMFKDNGKGIEVKKAADSDVQFGKKLIVLLAEEMNAEFQEYNDDGLTYIFKFKDKILNDANE